MSSASNPAPATATAAEAGVPTLFRPLKLRGLELRNRIAVSPMCQYSSEDGFFNDWHLVHLGSKAIGGAGLVFTEATAVEPEGRISPSDAGLWKDEHISFLRRITTFLRNQGAASGIQLAHAGRKGSTSIPWSTMGGEHLSNEQGGWDTKAPSAVSFGEHHLSKVPHELSIEEIHAITAKFVAAAQRAVAAGFDVIEIHAANGYLLHQFMSPLSNQRKDDYGGSLQNRTRFLLEVVTGIRAVIPATMPLFIRLNVHDWHQDGFTPDDAVVASQLLREQGVDLIDVTSGFVIGNYKDIPWAPAFLAPIASKIKEEAKIHAGVVGVIVDGAQANQVLEEGKADLVFLAREHLRDPQFAYHAAQKLNLPNPQSLLPIQYSHWLKERH